MHEDATPLPALTSLEFTAIGKPVPKGSVTAFVPTRKDGSAVTRPDGRPMVVKHDDSGKRGKTWAGVVADAAFEAMDAAGVAIVRGVPVRIEVEFYAPRPKSHYRTGRNAHLLRPDAPPAPMTAPDVDKLLRGILDALKNVVYADDGQVSAVTATKNFGDPARAVVRVTPYAAAVEAQPEGDQLEFAA